MTIGRPAGAGDAVEGMDLFEESDEALVEGVHGGKYARGEAAVPRGVGFRVGSVSFGGVRKG